MPALTLIEVLASLALLGTLLVSMLIAQGRLLRQSEHAVLKRQAVDIADDLLEAWWNRSEELPQNQQGKFDDSAMQWRTSTEIFNEFPTLELEKWVLEVYLTERFGGTEERMTTQSIPTERVLCRVELITHSTMDVLKNEAKLLRDVSDGAP